MALFRKLPLDYASWYRAAKKANLHKRSIRTFKGFKSISRITQEQFLLLRVLFPKEITPGELNIARLDLDGVYEKTKDWLKGCDTFQIYLKSIRENVEISPLMVDDSFNMGIFELVRSEQLKVSEAIGKSFTSIDEDTVNFALIALLSSLVIKCPDEMITWSAHRRHFLAEFRSGAYAAWVDGYAIIKGTKDLLALVEVKGRRREETSYSHARISGDGCISLGEEKKKMEATRKSMFRSHTITERKYI